MSENQPTVPAPVAIDDIDRELRQDSQYQHSGHAARTLIRVPDLRVVLMVMKAGSQIAEHHAPASASLHVLHGHVRLNTPEDTVELGAGSLFLLEQGMKHSVEAAQDSAFLLTLAVRAKK